MTWNKHHMHLSILLLLLLLLIGSILVSPSYQDIPMAQWKSHQIIQMLQQFHIATLNMANISPNFCLRKWQISCHNSSYHFLGYAISIIIWTELTGYPYFLVPKRKRGEREERRCRCLAELIINTDWDNRAITLWISAHFPGTVPLVLNKPSLWLCHRFLFLYLFPILTNNWLNGIFYFYLK